MIVLLASIVVTGARAADGDWPPFLPQRDRYAAGIVVAVERLWTHPTFSRTVDWKPAEVPITAYLRFVDAPDLTAAAARHLGAAPYEVHLLGDDWYEADDHAGARGVYRVLLREDGRRVNLSWGTHRSAILGTVSGSALSLLEFEERDGSTAQRLTARVLIDNRAAAALTRLLVPVFGSIVDRKLTEGFAATARVATWARAEPAAFCAWLSGAFEGARRDQLLETFSECRAPSASGRAPGDGVTAISPLHVGAAARRGHRHRGGRDEREGVEQREPARVSRAAVREHAREEQQAELAERRPRPRESGAASCDDVRREDGGRHERDSEHHACREQQERA